ncbi:hypothetical protein CJJ07_003040 [Candidozyma auris]|nr:hypothetical protein CJJ07_003040 [[Candida] auris]QEL60469.1 hypothetical protein CJJ09_002577 [[Candida] auris]
MKLTNLLALSASLITLAECTQQPDNDIQKREPKNVANLDYLFQQYEQDHKGEDSEENVKRKNVADLSNLEHLLEDEQESVEKDSKIKRDGIQGKQARRVFDPKSFFHAKMKRSQKVIKTYESSSVNNVLTQVRDVSVFAGYLRDSEKILKQLHKNRFAVIIAPSDHALSSKLGGRKPWEFPRDPNDENDAAANIQDFVKAHLVKFEGELSEIQDEVALLSFDGQTIVIRHDAATDSFRVEKGDCWTDVVAVYYADDGAVLVIDDSLVKPQN